MNETLSIGDLVIPVVRKNIKRVHLSVYPPDGRVVMTAPSDTRPDVLRAYAIAQLGWIRSRQRMFAEQARETQRSFVTRESHSLWGKRYLLKVVEHNAKPFIQLDHKSITLFIRPKSPPEKRAAVIHDWHKKLLHEMIPPCIRQWEAKLGVTVSAYFLQRMKTKWGSCNARAGNIRLNTELVKKPKDLVEYVIVHEMLHLIEPSHNDRFFELFDRYYPHWQEARAELNALPLSAETWRNGL